MQSCVGQRWNPFLRRLMGDYSSMWLNGGIPPYVAQEWNPHLHDSMIESLPSTHKSQIPSPAQEQAWLGWRNKRGKNN